MNERIKFLRKKENLSQAAFGKKLGVSRDVISNYENGRVALKELFINHVCSIFNVNKNWIETGKGDMYKTDIKEKKLADLLFLLSTSDESIHPIVRKLTDLDDDYLKMIEDLIDSMLEKQKK